LESVSFDGYSYNTQKVEVPGGNVVTYSIGTGREVLLVLHGGPGLSCDYVRDSHARLAGDRYRIVSYDQLGSGASDRPADPTLWRLGRFVEEVEAVRSALGLGKVHLFGQSWGAFLAVEYALTHKDALRTLILEGGAADMPHLASEMLRLKMALGSETVAMMARHEAEGTNDHPEYQGALTVLSWRHLCRLATWPESLKRSISPENMNSAIFNAIQGRNEFTITGNIKDWNRVADLHRIGQPALVLCGQYDEVTPDCAARMHRALPNSRITVFPNSSHTPFLEEPEAYFAVLKSFLDENTAVRL
jgi:proline iminopeptidase